MTSIDAAVEGSAMALWARTRKLRWWLGGIFGVLLIALIVARLLLPRYVLAYVNERLNSIEGYSGHVDDIDIHLYRGAYTIHGVKIMKSNGKVPVPFFEAKKIDFSMLWSALFDGSLVGKVYMEFPLLNFVDAPNPEERQTGAGRPWTKVIQDLFPFRLDRTEIVDGVVAFKNLSSTPKVDIYMNKVRAVATNLTNSKKLSKSLVAKIDAAGLVMNQAPFELHLDVDPTDAKPTFDVAAKIVELDVKQINDFTKAYANFDMEGGTFTFVTEMAAKQGHMQGYAKPLFKDLKVLTWGGDVERDKDNPLQLFWEGIVGLVGDVFQNQDKKQLATRVNLSGDLSDPNWSFFEAIGGVLRNAFIKAYQPNIEHSVALKGGVPKVGSKKQ